MPGSGETFFLEFVLKDPDASCDLCMSEQVTEEARDRMDTIIQVRWLLKLFYFIAIFLILPFLQ